VHGNWEHGAKSDHGHGPPAGDPGTVTVVADHLNNPRQIAVHGGAVYVAEAGTGGDQVSAVGDPASFECANDPDGQGVDTDPYGLAVRGNTFYVADAAGNDIVKIGNGTTSLAAVLSTTGQPVPTSLAWGPGGDLFVGTLNFEGGPGAATVYRLNVHTGDLSVYATG
jgi:hypothetical protein